MIDHLLKLGVTAIELMPVHYFVDDRQLIERGLRNYWGYNTIGFFAPMSRYLATASISEFKTMVKVMHSAGIEVILDVVYNHTAEGNQLGPTLSFRGIDNSVYYRTIPDNPRYYMDYTGATPQHRHACAAHHGQPPLLGARLHVDGIFPLRSGCPLARGCTRSTNLARFRHHSPGSVLSQVKLIAEPWDLGEGGYQVGKFSLAGPSGMIGTATPSALTGRATEVRSESLLSHHRSSDLYARSGRRPMPVLISSPPDGFTLQDLLSPEHNEANGEDTATDRQ